MASPRQRRALLLVVLGLALVLNGFWLFPEEGRRQYTYGRSEITVENGTFDYRNADDGPGHEYNDLVPVACDAWTADRACAFDAYLAAEGPVTLDTGTRYGSEPAFVEVRGRYYRRTSDDLENGTRYDVERVRPRRVLDEVARNLTGVTLEGASDLSLQTRVAASGEAESTTETPDREAVGRVYRREGTYYTVVVVDEGTVDWPVFDPWMRDLVVLLGIGSFASGVVVGGAETLILWGRRRPPNV